MRRRSLVVLILLLAFVLRLVRLQTRSLWYDEAFAVLYASLSPERMVYGTVSPVPGAGAADVHPLLYYMLLHGWMGLVGRSPLAVRFLSVGFGMLTVALLGRLANWCFDRRTGLAVGLLAATSPFHVAYSQEARMYALLGLTAVAAVWGLLRALEGAGGRRQEAGGRRQEAGSRRQEAGSRKQEAGGRRQEAGSRRQEAGSRRQEAGRRRQEAGSRKQEARGRRQEAGGSRWSRWSALYAGAAALTLYTHNLGAFVLLALHLLFVARRRWWHRLAALILADLVALALSAPWLVGVLPGQVGFVAREYWLAPPGVEEVVRAVMLPVFTFYEPAPVWLLGLGLFMSTLLLVLLALRTWRTRSRAGWFLLLCWVPVLSLMLVSCWRPVYLERALLPSALFYLCAVGWLLVRGGLPRLLRLGLAVLLAATTAGSLGVHYTYARFPRPPFDRLNALLRSRAAPGEVVIHDNKLTFFPAHYYDPRLPQTFCPDLPGMGSDTLALPTQKALDLFATPISQTVAGGVEGVWYVAFDRTWEEYRALGYADAPNRAWLRAHCHREGEVQAVADLEIYHFADCGGEP